MAWLHHWDTKQQNTLDMYVGEPGEGHVRHYLIDFGSTLGTAADGLQPMRGYELDFDPAAIGLRAITLGLKEDDWRGVTRPEGLAEVGVYESRYFDPHGFDAMQPNDAFVNLTDRDGYWAAKIISAFTDAQLEAAVGASGYRDPQAAAYVARTLGERRDKIVRRFFDRIPPLDFFGVEQGALRYRDLGGERGYYPGTTARYRFRLARVGADRGGGPWSPWRVSTSTRVDLEGDVAAAADPMAGRRPFTAVECQVDRGEGWSSSVKAYVARASGRVVAVDR
jgi:hypothetical protein